MLAFALIIGQSGAVFSVASIFASYLGPVPAKESSGEIWSATWGGSPNSIADGHLKLLVFRPLRLDGYLTPSVHILHRIDAVEHEVHENLLQLDNCMRSGDGRSESLSAIREEESATAFRRWRSLVAGGGFEPPTFGLCHLTHVSVRVGLYLHPRGMLAIQSTPSPSVEDLVRYCPIACAT
jgi:hypothetical protein